MIIAGPVLPAALSYLKRMRKVNNLTSTALRRAVRSLSNDADEQLAELRDLGCAVGVDELALQFHDQALLAKQLNELGEINDEELETVRRIDSLLDRMSGEVNAHLWTGDALRTSPQWAQVRGLAQEFLTLHD
ncbi:hypothetical protein [Rubinisphaera brasiliensis]|uniref:hypothetical protein n=1 Tax=Rubinisphaera brasiliensis TaxID=119 RepID=UPI0002F40083|nr:hypothetical protein [Rubinisphaera brasiliensis]